MEILFYQSLIFTTLVAVRFLFPKYLEVACFVWTALTLFNLFWPPLIVLQLIVVWGTYAIIRPKNLLASTERPNLQPNRSRPQKPERAAQKKNEFAPASRIAGPKTTIESSTAMNSIKGSEKSQANGSHESLATEKTSSAVAHAIPVDEHGLTATESKSVPCTDRSTQHFIVETKRRRVVVPKSGEAKSGVAASKKPALGDSSKRPAGISDAEMERRLRALRAAKARDADEAAIHTSKENISGEECERRPAVRQLVSEDNAPILSALKAKRRALAEAAGIPAYVIFTDRTLIAMAETRPATLDQLAQVGGVGAKKLECYGAAFLEVLAGEVEAKRLMHHEVNGLGKQNVQEIRAEVERRAIPHLVHFTRCENLPSIFRHGLLSVSDCRAQGIDAVRNDMVRLDGKPDGTSLSVTFPNYRMFYKYRQTDPVAGWAVLILPTRILWEKECGFFKYNAADARMRMLPREQSATVQALQEMFANSDTPRQQWLRTYDPTDPQAEIMVYEAIEPNLIETVAFETKDVAEKWKRVLGGIDTIYAGKGKGLFGSRAQLRGN